MNTYDYITDKINKLKTQYPSLRQSKEDKADDYAFSALCIKANFYKNPELPLNDNDFDKMIVDGSKDLGIDILLIDPNSEGNDLIIGQSKFHKDITSEKVLNALRKMADGYKTLLNGHYEDANGKLGSRFIELYDKLDEESKIHFVFYTSAPKKSISKKRLETKFLEEFIDTDNIEIEILFDTDIKKAIEDAASWKSIVESGKIFIDKAKNYLTYGNDAVIVNVSAFSIKKLYTEHKTNLLALNLRYHIKENKRDSVDNKIKNTIDNAPSSFWLKNNGITIICDSFDIDGREVHLRNFSIVNGGQTTFQIYKNSNIDAAHDFYLPCKVIKNIGETKDDKMRFSLEIAEATNSQKPIQAADLKANAPEQRRFHQAMKEVGVLYVIKRSDEKPNKKYDDKYLNTNLAEVGKLCLAAIFQEPGKSKNTPSESYNNLKYYTPIFKNNHPKHIASICAELLYMDYYFDKIFRPKFNRENKNLPDSANKINFANNARRICVAFTALAARYHQGNITDEKLTAALNSAQTDLKKVEFYNVFSDIGEMKYLLPKHLSENMDFYDATLDKLFEAIIEEGILVYSFKREGKPNLTENSFLQNDKNYYTILQKRWSALRRAINEIFQEG